MKTPEEFKAQAELKGIKCWPIRNCSMCGYQLAYIFNGDDVYFDSGCDCTGTQTMNPRSWDTIAEHYNRQTHPDVIKRMDEFWGFAEVAV